MQLVCEVCEKQFENVRPRRGCSKACTSELMAIARKIVPWKDIELRIIKAHIGSLSPKEIYKQLCVLWELHELPTRTYATVYAKLIRTEGFEGSRVTGWNSKPGCISQTELARRLDVHITRVRLWRGEWGLPSTGDKGEKFVYISIEAFKGWALKNKPALHGVDTHALYELTGCKGLCKTVATMQRPKCTTRRGKGNARPVVNTTTGKQYKSAVVAADAMNVTSTAIRRAIRTKGRCCGDYWAYPG